MNAFRALALYIFLVLICAPVFAQSAAPGVLAVTPSLSKNATAPGEKIELILTLKIQKPFHVNSNPASEKYLIPVTVKIAGEHLKIGAPIYPKGVLKKFEFSDKPLSVYEGEVEVRVPMGVLGYPKNGPREISGSVRYQACNDKSCLIPAAVPFRIFLEDSSSNIIRLPGKWIAPNLQNRPQNFTEQTSNFTSQLKTRFKIQGLPQIVFLDASGNERKDLRAGEELQNQGKEVFLQKLDALKSGAKWSQNEGAGSWLSRLQNAPLWSQLILVFFGGLLLNLTPCVYPLIPITVGFFGAQSENKFSSRASLAALYVLGLALVYSTLGVIAALTGKLFGAALQSPLVPGFVAIVLFALALSMFGLFTISPPKFILQKSGAKRGALGALAMGALLGFVAAPCVGPVVVALLTYVGTRANPFLGFILFFVLSLGLGLPYLFLGIFSGVIKSLPKSGVWLERLKKIFAVPLVLASLYYGYLAFNAMSSARESTPTSSHWPDATSQLLEDARKNGKPVVLDFRADWCVPCLQLEREIFSKPEVLVRQKDVVLLRVDLTRDES